MCKSGYVPTSFRTCEEHDLCSHPATNPCDSHAVCKKTGPAKVACTCSPGYGGNGYACQAVDGCGGTPCGEHGICVRQPLGGRTCSCESGFEADKKSKQFKCNEIDMCGRKPCKGKNTYCKKTGPGKHSCLCNAGFMPFWSGDCYKPGSKEALQASADEGSEAAKRELEAQKAKAREAERRRKELERQFRLRQKEREESIRALERRIRDLIRDRTTARVVERDRHVATLTERIQQLEAQQVEAAKLATTQLSFIKQLEEAETHKVDRLAEAMKAASVRVGTEVRRYAERLRQVTREQLHDTPVAPAPKASAAPAKKKKEKEPAKKPVPPPQYGNNINPLKPLSLGVNKRKSPPKPLAAPKPVAPKRRSHRRRHRRHHRRHRRRGGRRAAAAAAVAPPSTVTARFQQVDLQALADVDLDTDADAAQLESELAALHADVDGHVSEVLAHEDDAEDLEEEDQEEEEGTDA